MRKNGFTLIELLVAVGITTIALTFITYFVLDLSHFGVDLGDRLESERELELTMRVMVSEMRSMGPSANGSYPVAIASATTFQFYSDIDGDGSFEQVRYFLNGTTFQKGVTDPVGTPATYPVANEIISDVVRYMVPGTIFTYYAEGFPSEVGTLPSPTDVAKIRLLKVTGTVDRDITKPPTATTLSIYATIRNLRGEI